MLFKAILPRLVTVGSLEVIDPSGRRHRFGPGGAPDVTVRLRDRALLWRLAINPGLSVGEAYMDGGLTIERGLLTDFLHICVAGLEALEQGPLGEVRRWAAHPLRRLHQYNPIWRAKANVAHHYDLSGDLYELFLDADRQYSCAYFKTGTVTVEQAQHDKKQHIAVKLLLKPRMRVLDIGSGWGGLALHLTQLADVDVTGITLSQEQLRVAQKRAATGLLDAQSAAAPWHSAAAWRALAPGVRFVSAGWTEGRKFHSALGGRALAQFLLHCVARQFDAATAGEIAHALNIDFRPGRAAAEGRDLLAPPCHPAVRAAIRVMHGSLDRRLETGDICAAANNVSERTLQRLFRRHLKTTIGAYHRACRLEHARELLRLTPLSVMEIALTAGFESPTHFSHSYRRHFGRTPRQDR